MRQESGVVGGPLEIWGDGPFRLGFAPYNPKFRFWLLDIQALIPAL